MIDINNAYEEVISYILNCDGRWQFDDTNFTTFPEATTTLVANQKDYTFDASHLEIVRVQIKDTAGNWYTVDPIDRQDIDEPLETIFNTSGTPQYYDKDGSSIVLYPAPATGSVTLTAGLKVFFKRTASVFTSAEVTTGTKLPGFASPFHQILSYIAATDYCSLFKPERVPRLMAKTAELKKGLEEFYGHREQDRRKIIETKPISFR